MYDQANLLFRLSTEKEEIANTMKTYGGSFVYSLADCILRADPINLRKIVMSWPEYIEEYLPEKWNKQ